MTPRPLAPPFRRAAARWRAGTLVERHGHVEAYAAFVVEGAYEEAGTGGRRRVSAGDVLIHRAFDVHLDRIGPQGARVVNLRLPDPGPGVPRHGRIRDFDRIVRGAEARSTEVAAVLRTMTAVPLSPKDWPDELAALLEIDPAAHLGEWASARSLRPEALSRGFRKVFGVTAARFRAEARARRAWRRIMTGSEPLARVAAETGFADQAHMTRAVIALTGRAPGEWRSGPRRPDR